jgi:hypothetical protein
MAARGRIKTACFTIFVVVFLHIKSGRSKAVDLFAMVTASASHDILFVGNGVQ